MTIVRTLVVDDERLAREGIGLRLREAAGVEVIGEAADGHAAVKAILKLRPALVFLDVQLPGFNGFEVLKRVGAEHLPLVIFVTAYDRYAVQAFEIQAVDYLLKPVSANRFDQALQRVRSYLADEVLLGRAHRRLLNSVYPDEQSGVVRHDDPPSDEVGVLRRLAVKQGDRFLVLKTDEIDWIDTAANYVQLHVREKTFLLRMTMNELEERLDPQVFVRVHRTTIVNLDRVLEITPDGSGSFTVLLRDGKRVSLSRTHRDRFFSRLTPQRPHESGGIE